jgi:hypothetical protein
MHVTLHGSNVFPGLFLVEYIQLIINTIRTTITKYAAILVVRLVVISTITSERRREPQNLPKCKHDRIEREAHKRFAHYVGINIRFYVTYFWFAPSPHPLTVTVEDAGL